VHCDPDLRIWRFLEFDASASNAGMTSKDRHFVELCDRWLGACIVCSCCTIQLFQRRLSTF
jgi:hypothetical protein